MVRMLPAPADACPSLPEASLAGAGAKEAHASHRKRSVTKGGSCGCSTSKTHTPHGDSLSHGQF